MKCDFRGLESSNPNVFGEKSDAAAKCYRLAQCYSKAAKAYAEGNDLNRCLSACEEGQLFDEGLLYIETWKEDCRVEGEELIRIKQKFLETCSIYFHSHKDSKSMMKFVRAFCSMESKRVFLKSLGCLDELLEVEEESGNFCEALELARSWGDIVKEAELLEKARDFEGATDSLCCQAILNSLWGNGNRGWPLNRFSEGETIREKAISLAAKASEKKYIDVCRFFEVVSSDRSSLPKLNAELLFVIKHGTSVEQLFSVRKILEYHFMTRLSEYEWADEFSESIYDDKVVLQSLVFIWNNWKSIILKILDSFKADESKFFELSLKYLGVSSKASGKGKMDYVILNKDAYWLKHCDGLHTKGKCVSCNGHELVSAMTSYWQSEIYTVGIKVLETLDKALQVSKTNAYRQSKCFLSIFDVSSSILNNLNLAPSYERKLRNFQSICTSYVDILFPLDWRNAVSSRELIALRRSVCSRNLLRWIMEQDIYIKGLTTLTTGKIIMLSVESWLPEAFYVTSIDKCNLKFKELLETIRSSYSIQPSVLARALALEEKLEDSISPNCFLYSLDFLMTIASMSSGPFFTTRSSFVRNVVGDIKKLPQHGGGGYYPSTIDLISQIINKVLKDKSSTIFWIRKSNIDNVREYHRLLVLKLTMTLTLACLNGGLGIKDGGLGLAYKDADMSGILVGVRKDIADMLPNQFSNLLRRRESCLSPKVVAEAFSSVDDPLVILCSGDISIDAPCAIIVDPSKPEDEIMDLLSSRNTENVAHESGTSHVEEKINDLPVKDIQTDGSRKGKKGKNSGKGKKK